MQQPTTHDGQTKLKNKKVHLFKVYHSWYLPASPNSGRKLQGFDGLGSETKTNLPFGINFSSPLLQGSSFWKGKQGPLLQILQPPLGILERKTGCRGCCFFQWLPAVVSHLLYLCLSCGVSVGVSWSGQLGLQGVG